MYLEKIGEPLKIIEEIENYFIKDQTGSLLIKGISNVLIMEKSVISNRNVRRNPRIIQSIGTFDF